MSLHKPSIPPQGTTVEKAVSPSRADTGSSVLAAAAAKLMHMEAAIGGLRREVQVWKSEISKSQHALVSAETALETLETARRAMLVLEVNRQEVAPPDGFIPLQRKRKNSLSWLVRENTYKILKAIGRPLNSSELMDELKVLGIEIDGDKPEKKINKILWNAKKQFYHVESGYWIVGLPQPENVENTRRRRTKTAP